MEICIIGAGAIGGVVGAHLVRSGHDVLFCDVDKAHVQAMNQEGLHIEGPVENFSVPVKAVTPEDLPQSIKHVAIAVKNQDTEAALALIENRLTSDGWVITLQNNHNFELITEAVGEERTIAGFVNFGADYLEPGRIMQGNVATFMVGEISGESITQRVRELCDALPYAQPTSNIHGYLGSKRVYGAMLAAGAISDLSIADSLSDPRFRTLMLAVAQEVKSQLHVKFEPFDGFDANKLEDSLENLVQLNRNSAKTHSGIYRDLAIRKRKTEVHALFEGLTGSLITRILEIITAIEEGRRICQIANLELLNAYHEVCRVNSSLHAVVELIQCPNRSQHGPLLGEAIGVKDLIDIEGVRKSNGNPNLISEAALKDNPVVKHLREQGADIFARTALLEYAAGALHPDIAETMNPWDITKTAGGSSGGSAALVAAGISRISLGTDTGGSIRIPASYCGIVGFKPTYNKLSLEGVTPLSPTFDHLGFLAASVSDLQRVWSTFERINEDQSGITLGMDASLFEDSALAGEVLVAFKNACEKLERAGFAISTFDASIHRELEATFETILLFELWQVHGERATNEPSHFGSDTLRLILSAKDIGRGLYESMLQRRVDLLPHAEEIYSKYSGLISPTVPYVAPETTPPIDTELGAVEGKYTSIYNITGAPAISLPIGLSCTGLPIGMQIAGGFGQDSFLLDLAAKIESTLGQVMSRDETPKSFLK